MLNASVEVPIDASPWHYRIASVNFEQPEYVLLTSRTANNAEDVVDIQSLYAINARLSNDAQTVTSTIAAKSDNVNNIAHIKSVWQTVFSKNLLPHIADKEKKTNIFPTSDKSSREVKESQSDVDWSLTVEQPTALGPETDIDRAEERRMLQAAAVTPIENMRAMRLPLLLELAKSLKGGVKAVDRISRVAGGKAEGVFRPNTRQIEVLRRLAGPQLLGKPIMVPADKVDEQRKLWTDFWTAKGVPESELEITETPVGSEVRMEAMRHDRTLAKFREVAGHEIGHLIDYNAGNTTSKCI